MLCLWLTPSKKSINSCTHTTTLAFLDGPNMIILASSSLFKMDKIIHFCEWQGTDKFFDMDKFFHMCESHHFEDALSKVNFRTVVLFLLLRADYFAD